MLQEALVQVDEQQFPLTITFEKNTPVDTLIEWYRNNTAYIDEQLLKKGAVLIQGVAINTVPDFERMTASVSTKFRNWHREQSSRCTSLNSSRPWSDEHVGYRRRKRSTTF